MCFHNDDSMFLQSLFHSQVSCFVHWIDRFTIPYFCCYYIIFLYQLQVLPFEILKAFRLIQPVVFRPLLQAVELVLIERPLGALEQSTAAVDHLGSLTVRVAGDPQPVGKFLVERPQFGSSRNT